MAGRTLYNNSRFSVESVDATISRKTLRFERIKQADSVTVLAAPDKDSLLIEKRYMPALKRLAIELPFGLIKQGETPKNAAIRIVREQTGYEFSSYTMMLKAFINPHLNTQKSHFYIARDMEKVHNFDRDGMSSFTPVKLEALYDMIRSNYIKDNKTIAGVLFYMKVYGRE